MTRWFDEILHDGYALRLRADAVLCEHDTGHQRLAIFETALFGRALVLDDIVQTTERDEFIYHEMIVHVPLLALGAARRVLVIGGGDGGAIEEVLKHRAVEHVRLVELDGAVIKACREYLPLICGEAFDDARLSVTIGDGLWRQAPFLWYWLRRHGSIAFRSKRPSNADTDRRRCEMPPS